MKKLIDDILVIILHISLLVFIIRFCIIAPNGIDMNYVELGILVIVNFEILRWFKR